MNGGRSESVAIYFNYAQDNDAHREDFNRVVDYNEDDCRTTMVNKDCSVQLKAGA